MNKWPYEINMYSPDEVQLYCVNDSYWQTVRIGMKGMPTTKKLDILEAYALNRATKTLDYKTIPRNIRVQCDNYINALKRGGQLNMELEVVR